MHFDLDLHLRTPGRLMLLERNTCATLVDRAFERQGRSGGWLGRLLGSTRPAAEQERGETIAMPAVRWAGDVVHANGFALVEGVAVIDIDGVMTPDGYYDWWSETWVAGYAQIGEALDAALADDRVRAILLRVNSPGGLVDGCFDLAARIRAGRDSKPVWAHCRMACSAAYALASGATRIIANAEADVGSIGVLIMHYDFSQMYAEWGLKVEAIQSGERKTDGAEWKPLSEEGRAHLSGVVGQVANSFVATVVAGRGLTEQQVRDQQAQWFLAQHDDPSQSGLGLGLVDEIGTERAAFAALIHSLSDETGTGAPAGDGATARADHEGESDMTTLTATIAALRKKAKAGDKKAEAELKKFGVSLEAEDTEAGADETAEGEGEEEAEADEENAGDDEPEAEGEDEEDGDEDAKEPSAKATGNKAGFALLGSKEAKGREALANKLGSKVAAGKINYGEAKSMLAAAPKASRLGEAMAGKDRNPGQSEAGKQAATGLSGAIDRLNAKRTRK